MVRNRPGISKNLKDYMVPIIVLIIVILILFSVFSWWDKDNTNLSGENQVWLNVIMDTPNTEWYIVYPWDYKKKIEWNTFLYKGEKVIMKEWSVSLNLSNVWDIKLNKLWELKYGEEGNLYLYSSELWINSKSKLNLIMRYAKISIWENTSVSFSQNEVWSTIYLLKWFTEISNLVWKSTVLAPWQKITISRLDASKKDLDLLVLKEELWDYFKTTDWYIKNNGDAYLQTKNENDLLSVSWSTSSWSIKKITDDLLISFNNLIDDSQVSSSSISVSWTYSDETIASITLNWEKAVLDKEKKSFKFEKVITENKINDLVFRVYDDSWELLQKKLFTVYYEWWTSKEALSTGPFRVKNYDIDWSKFTFFEPSTTNSFTTTSDFVTIKWRVWTKWVSSILVNDYKLKSYNWNDWRYHASTSNSNLENGTNVYEIKYFDENGKLVYTNYYTIVKKTGVVEEKGTGVISSEVKVQ